VDAEFGVLEVDGQILCRFVLAVDSVADVASTADASNVSVKNPRASR
jgi:hypothetical protein